MEDHVARGQAPAQVPETSGRGVKGDRWNTEKMAEAHHARLPDWDQERKTGAVGETLGCCSTRCMGQGQDDRLEIRLDVGIEDRDRIDIDLGDKVVGVADAVVDLVDMSLVDPDSDVLPLGLRAEEHTALVDDYTDPVVEVQSRTDVGYEAEKQGVDGDCHCWHHRR